ncbi:MAG: VanZ family protein [Gammaproteobacteria bacterium]
MLTLSARFISLLLAIAWAGLIFYLSSQPGIHTPLLFPGQDKLFHLIAFGMLGFLLMGTLKATNSGYRTGQVWFVVLLVASYGVLDEFHQYFVPGRSVEFYDALADAAGGLLGAWGMFYLVKILGKSSRTRSAPAKTSIDAGALRKRD